MDTQEAEEWKACIAGAIYQVFHEMADGGEGISQDELAYRLGIGQPAVSRWKRGEVTPDLLELADIEKACGVPRSTILALAGWLEDMDPVNIATAIALDKTLDPLDRRYLRRFFDSLLEHRLSKVESLPDETRKALMELLQDRRAG